jgi:hypothetical protein
MFRPLHCTPGPSVSEGELLRSRLADCLQGTDPTAPKFVSEVTAPMTAKQIVLPFLRQKTGRQPNKNTDLIGRAYDEGHQSRVTIVGICAHDDRRVIVQRDVDNRTWSMPGWLIRMVLLESESRQAA